MNREILFRAKTVNVNDWVESMTLATGTINRKRGWVFMEIRNKWKRIIPETLGQFTGLTDKNIAKTFEGDIVKIPASMHNIEIIGIVIFKNGRFLIKSILSGSTWDIAYSDKIEIVGNIHDNPELL